MGIRNYPLSFCPKFPIQYTPGGILGPPVDFCLARISMLPTNIHQDPGSELQERNLKINLDIPTFIINFVLYKVKVICG
jgi:hypothetical protein